MLDDHKITLVTRMGGLIAISFFFTVLSARVVARQNPQQLFDRANRQLQKGNIRQALFGYKKLESEKQVSGALFLNMGLSYVRLDSLGRAKYYFLKARRFEETRSRANKGLKYVNGHFSHQSAVLPILPWQRAINWLRENVGLTLLLVLGLLLFNAGVFLYVALWFTRKNRPKSGGAAIGVGILGGLVLLLGFLIHYRQKRYHQAVMVHKKTIVREKPNPQATMVSPAYEGYTFRADLYKGDKNKKDKWTYVRMSNGQYGWIPTNEIMIL